MIQKFFSAHRYEYGLQNMFKFDGVQSIQGKKYPLDFAREFGDVYEQIR